MALLRDFESLVQLTAFDDGKEEGKRACPPPPHPVL